MPQPAVRSRWLSLSCAFVPPASSSEERCSDSAGRPVARLSSAAQRQMLRSPRCSRADPLSVCDPLFGMLCNATPLGGLALCAGALSATAAFVAFSSPLRSHQGGIRSHQSLATDTSRQRQRDEPRSNERNTTTRQDGAATPHSSERGVDNE